MVTSFFRVAIPGFCNLKPLLLFSVATSFFGVTSPGFCNNKKVCHGALKKISDKMISDALKGFGCSRIRRVFTHREYLASGRSQLGPMIAVSTAVENGLGRYLDRCTPISHSHPSLFLEWDSNSSFL
jgi:hypothetical protein